MKTTKATPEMWEFLRWLAAHYLWGPSLYDQHVDYVYRAYCNDERPPRDIP